MKNKLKVINMLNRSYKKILLIFLGFLMALIILEITMQAAGFSMLYYRDYKNNKALKNKSKYKIMCLGESTTYGGYPKELQKILNQKYSGKFTVIDCGIPATNLDSIFKMLNHNIAKYHPDGVVCMMGINDGIVSFESGINNPCLKNSKLKTFKLFNFIKSHISIFFKEKNKSSHMEDNGQKKYAYQLYEDNLYSQATVVFEDILKQNPNDIDAIIFLAMIRYYYLNYKDSAYLDVLNIMKSSGTTVFYCKDTVYQLAYQLLIDYKKDVESRTYFANMIINDENAIINSNIYHNLKNFVTEEQKNKLLKKLSSWPNLLDQYYGISAIESLDKKDYKKAEECFRTAEEFRLKYPNERTYGLYKLIIKKLTDNNIKVICMQYPVRSIEPLKQMLKNERYYGQIEFLSNEESFKNLLKIKKYDDIFADQFAGDFGHCLDSGNILIAENVVESLSKLVQ